MRSTKLVSALTLVVALVAIAVVSRTSAHAASAAKGPTLREETLGLCYHTDPSDYNCPDTTAATALLSYDATLVQRVSITVVDKAGKSYTRELPATTDAVFLSAKSVRNFLLRYYQATKATKKASTLSAYLTKHTGPKPTTKGPAN